MSAYLRLVLHQTAPTRGEVDANLAEIRARLAASAPAPDPDGRGAPSGRTLAVFPELSTTGYGLGSRTRELALPTAAAPPVSGPEGIDLLLGFPEAASDGRVFNAAGIVRGDAWLHRYRKCFLPTYGAFDEGRFFAASREGPRPVALAEGWRVVPLICEDLWHPSLTYLASLQGADVVVAIAAAPGRGGGEGIEGAGGGFASMATWERMASALALFHQVWVVVVNRAGVEGGVTFAGGSFVVRPDGEVVRRAGTGPETLSVDLDPGAVAHARRLGAHIRDEDGSLLLRELERILHPDRDR